MLRRPPLRAATPLVCGVVFLAIAVRSLKRFFRGMLSPDGVIVALGALCLGWPPVVVASSAQFACGSHGGV